MITKKRYGNLLLLNYADKAWLEGYYDEGHFQLTNLFTREEERRKGYGSALLNRMLYEMRRNNVRTIEVDDCTDLENNIYAKHGFTYIKEGWPEMILEFQNSGI